MLRAALALLLGTALILGPAAQARAPSTMAPYGETYSPEQTRQMKATISRLTRQLGVREDTLAAIARILGAELKTVSFAEILTQLETLAKQAADLRAEVAALKKRLADFSDPAIRDPGRRLLDKASKAIDEGRLDDADLALSQLIALRWPPTETARDAWAEAVDRRIALAKMRLDEDLAYRIASEARAIERRRDEEERGASLRRQWNFAMAEADAFLSKGERLGDTASLQRALSLYRDDVLPLAPRRERPMDWATTQHEIGSTLKTIGEREDGTESLEQAIRAYETALLERTFGRAPHEWAISNLDLGSALAILGARERGTERLQLAVEAFNNALKVLRPDSDALLWALAQNNVGNALVAIGDREGGSALYRKAIEALERSLLVWTRRAHPRLWVTGQNNLGIAIASLGEREADVPQLERAIEVYRLALEELPREYNPALWAKIHNNLGLARSAAGRIGMNVQRSKEAVESFDLALTVWTERGAPFYWAAAHYNRAMDLEFLFDKSGDPSYLDRSLSSARKALPVFNAASPVFAEQCRTLVLRLEAKRAALGRP